MTETETTAQRATLITGAAGGIGRELVRRFGRDGQRIVAVDRDEAGLQRLRAEMAGTVDLAILAFDLTDPEATAGAVQGILAEYGRLDIVIHNAGVTQLGPFQEADAAGFRRVVEVNLMGAVELTRQTLPALLQSRGRMAVMSSVAGIAPLVDRCAYAASKHALHGFFESLRAELHGTGVSVTMVCPTFTATAIAEHSVGDRGDGKVAAWTTTGRILTPDEVAERTFVGTMERRRIVFPSSTSRVAWLLSRLAPAFYERTMRRRIRGV